ncbi:MAG: nnr 1 [Gemmataceae bacterium]|nr:nnr 1 [Gemmataceae bacterium]
MTTFWLSRDEVRELDRRAIEEFGIPGVVLMENAGRGCADLVMKLNPDRKPVVILCGPGNNGGDGFVAARHLDNHNWPVIVWLLRPESQRAFGFGQAVAAGGQKLSPDCRTNCEIWAHSRPLATDDTPGNAWKEALVRDVTDAGWVVDALFGTGLTRPLGAPYNELIPFLTASGRPILAVDLPSGLDCDSGEPLGPTVTAAHTATFVASKKGFLHPEAHKWTGEIHVVDIGAPRALVEEFARLRGERGA